MKNTILLLMAILFTGAAFGQETNTYDETLANTLGADERGMKHYIFCILKTGPNIKATQDEKNKIFQGHMDNINRLANEGKLAIAGPFGENNRGYRGVFVFNVATIEEAQALVDTDPAIKSKLLVAELTPWYASAALMAVLKIHDRINRSKF